MAGQGKLEAGEWRERRAGEECSCNFGKREMSSAEVVVSQTSEETQWQTPFKANHLAPGRHN